MGGPPDAAGPLYFYPWGAMSVLGMLEATLPLSPCLTSTLQLAVVMEPDFAASASYRELQRADSCSVEHPWDHGTAHPRDGAADLNRGGAVSRYDAVNELDPWTDSAGAVFSYCEKHVNGASGCHQ